MKPQQPYIDVLSNNPEYIYATVIVILLMAISLVVYALAIRSLYTQIYPDQSAMGPVIAIVSMLSILPIMDYNIKLYDYSCLALSALCLLYSHEQKWTKYLACFTLAAINKETAFLQIAAFALLHDKKWKARKFHALFIIQIMLYILVTLAVHWTYGQNRGNFIIHLNEGIRYPFFTMSRLANVITIVIMLHLILRRWHEIPLQIRKCLWLIPLLFALYSVCGQRFEYRVFYDIYPYILLTAGYSLLKIPERKNI